MSADPVFVEMTRGGIAESRHAGAFAVVGSGGTVVASAGDIECPVFPRSAIKALQCLAAVEAGVVEAFGMIDEEIALACASHKPEPDHVRVARSGLAKAGLDEAAYECGGHWPFKTDILVDMAKNGEQPGQVHNNCSGKHSFMLALAKKLGADPQGYVKRDHPVQQAIETLIADMCDYDLAKTPCGVDGCSVPTWAIPLRNTALGFQKFASGEGLSADRKVACERIISVVRAHPFMVAGTDRFCTRVMSEVPRVFAKVGAEGFYCAAVPHAKLGIALKCDDGAGRAAEVLLAHILSKLDCWTADEQKSLDYMTIAKVKNWRGIETGQLNVV